MSYKEKALELHAQGYNCSQSVLCAFEDQIGLPREVLFKISEGFGLGMGNMQGTCGAISGAIAALGFISSNGNYEVGTPKSKAATYKRTRNILEGFEQARGSIRCKDLKTVNGPSFTPCSQCVALAAELLEKELSQNN